MGFFSAMRVTQEVIDVHQARAGDNALETDVAEAGNKVAEQLNFQFGAGRKIAVAALRRKNLISISVPEKPGFAESGSGGDHRLVSDGHPFHAVESDLVLLSETGDPPGIGFEVIDQKRRSKMQFAGQARGFHRPGKV